MTKDERFMRRALELARHGVPEASPNPFVGCVLVKNGRIVGEGWHARFGRSHAEPAALKKAGKKAKGATAYVTLEPCCEHAKKKTPPCVPALIAAGIRRLVAATGDPNRAVCGRGFAALRRAGIKVEVGVLAHEAARLNRPFFTRMRLGRPYVILKAAASLDGRVATARGESKWITSPEARREGWRLRASVDAILVGAGTIKCDDPALTAHGEGRDPLRVILHSHGALPRKAKALRGPIPTVVYSKMTIPEVLKRLGERGVGTVLVEGGGRVHAAFLDAGLVDEVRLFLAPKLIGGADAPTFFEGRGAARLKDSLALSEVDVRRIGPDLMVSGVLGRAARVF